MLQVPVFTCREVIVLKLGQGCPYNHAGLLIVTVSIAGTYLGLGSP